MPPPIRLRDLLARAFDDAGIEHYSIVNGSEEPMLTQAGPNRLLVYCGAFSPPHRGHVSCFIDGIADCAREYQATGGLLAAIPIPLDDATIRTRKKQPHALPSTQRAALLAAHLHHPTNSTTTTPIQAWSTSRAAGVADFIRPAAAAAHAHGVPLDFVVLRGGDHMYFDRAMRSPRASIAPRCTRLLFAESAGRFPLPATSSGAGPPAGSADGMRAPRRFLGAWGAWAPRGAATGVSGAQLRLWACVHPGEEGEGASEARLLMELPAAAGAAEVPVAGGFSSTTIRRVIAEDLMKDREVFVANLRAAGAVSAEKLASLLVAAEWERRQE